MKDKFKKTALGKWLLGVKHTFPIARPAKSYSQRGEDILLDWLVQYKKNGFYVDIGAYDPVSISNTYKFYKRGWKGIQIEPNYKRSLLFKRYRPDTITLNIGIGDAQKTVPFYLFQEESLSTFSKESSDLNISKGYKLKDIRDVEMLPLSSVFEKYLHNQPIDILSVDTEGYDMEVLKTNNWQKFRPRFVVVETAEYTDNTLYGTKLNSMYDPYMESIGYVKVVDTYLNTIYTDKDVD